MLTWKIIVIIISVTSLTFVNMCFSSDLPSSTTPRPHRTSLPVNMNYSNNPHTITTRTPIPLRDPGASSNPSESSTSSTHSESRAPGTPSAFSPSSASSPPRASSIPRVLTDTSTSKTPRTTSLSSKPRLLTRSNTYKIPRTTSASSTSSTPSTPGSATTPIPPRKSSVSRTYSIRNISSSPSAPSASSTPSTSGSTTIPITPRKPSVSNTPSESSTPSTPPKSKTPSKSRSTLSHLKVYDPDKETIFTINYNSNNPFQTESESRCECYKQIRMFCDDDVIDLKSENCIKKAILYYKKNLKIEIKKESTSIISCLSRIRINPVLSANIFNNFKPLTVNNFKPLSDVVHKFYEHFPLDPGRFPLPSSFCRQKATEWLKKKKDGEEEREDGEAISQGKELLKGKKKVKASPQVQELFKGQIKVKAVECMAPLLHYQAFVPKISMEEAEDQLTVRAAKAKARHRIAKFALFDRTIIGMPENNTEKLYLEEISKFVGAEREDHTPIIYCQNS